MRPPKHAGIIGLLAIVTVTAGGVGLLLLDSPEEPQVAAQEPTPENCQADDISEELAAACEAEGLLVR